MMIDDTLSWLEIGRAAQFPTNCPTLHSPRLLVGSELVRNLIVYRGLNIRRVSAGSGGLGGGAPQKVGASAPTFRGEKVACGTPQKKPSSKRLASASQ